jgi:hypothetical protein
MQREKAMRNFVKSRGLAKFRYLISAFEQNISGQVIADQIGVTRERVRQWRDMFGMTITFYEVAPEARRLLGGR